MTRIGPWILACALAVAASTCADQRTTPAFDPMRGSLPRLEPQAVYSRDRNDPWNLVFYLLFTRTVQSRLTASGAEVFMGMDDRLRLSDRPVTRIEEGDRAIDPLYPSWAWVSSEYLDETAPSYLPMAGNDFLFASPPKPGGYPVLSPLRDRCAACHGQGIGKLFTFSVTGPGGTLPPVRRLDPSANTRALGVAQSKLAREDFKVLQREWFSNGR